MMLPENWDEINEWLLEQFDAVADQHRYATPLIAPIRGIEPQPGGDQSRWYPPEGYTE